MLGGPFSSALSPESGSFQGLRSSGGTIGWEQGSMSSGLSVREKGLAGTRVTWLLSQMMRDNETPRRCPLWVALKTPSLSHQNLQGGKEVSKNCTRNLQDLVLQPYLSPSLSALNCLASRQDSSGPTRPPGSGGSEMAPTQTSMLCGVPYSSWSL